MYTFNLSTQESETDGSLSISEVNDSLVYSKFKDSWVHIAIPCLKKENQEKKIAEMITWPAFMYSLLKSCA